MSRARECFGAGGLSLLLRRWALDLKMLAPFLFLKGLTQEVHMADLFEDIITGWLTSKGYFVIQGLKAGRKELDILAVKVRNGKIEDGVHVEVQCSSDPMAYLDRDPGKKDQKQINETVKDYIKKKYYESPVKQKAEFFLGKKYEKWFIYGRLKDEPMQVKSFKANGIVVKRMGEILNELLAIKKSKNKESFTTADSNRFQQMLKLYDIPQELSFKDCVP